VRLAAPATWERWLPAEIYRVVKPGGSIILSLLFGWQEHEVPYDFFRFTRFCITELFEKAGFSIEAIVRDSGAAETLAVVTNRYIINCLVPRVRGLGRIVSLLFCLPLQRLAMLPKLVLPDQGQLISTL